MKRKLLMGAFLLAGAFSSTAQIADGSVAPDFTVTDINGNSHSLYADYLNNGYSVILDISATWCGPCWSYHQGGTLEDVWANHGPLGEPGVLATSTDDVVILWVEGDGSTPVSEITGGGSSLGDWTVGVDFPMIDAASVASSYQISYYPSMFTICQAGIVYESGQLNATDHYAFVQNNCPVITTGTDIGAAALQVNASACPNTATDVDVEIQNLGTDDITSATVDLYDGATLLGSGSYSGTLTSGGVATVTVSGVSVASTTTATAVITTSGDVNNANESTSIVINIGGDTDQTVTVQLLTDNYANETYMEITDGSGNVVWSEGNETVAGNYNVGAGTPAADPTSPLANNTTLSWDVSLSSLDCYEFHIYDFYGDGLGAAQWGGTDGSFSVDNNNGNVIINMSAADFGGDEGGNFKNNTLASINEVILKDLAIYPNPATDVLNVEFSSEASEYTVAILDLQGRVLASESGSQNVAFQVADLAAGSYLVTITTELGVHTQNVVIK